MKYCEGPEKSCEGQPFDYPGQTAGDHVTLDEDSDYPEWYYANPIPGRDGSMQPPRFENLPRTNVEGRSFESIFNVLSNNLFLILLCLNELSNKHHHHGGLST